MSADAEEAAATATKMSPRARAVTWVAIVVTLVVASWIGWGLASQPVRWRDVGFAAPSATEATTTFDVFLYTDADAVCRVRALNDRHAEVGAADVTILRSAGSEQRLTASIVTVEQATTAVVAYCSAP